MKDDLKRDLSALDEVEPSELWDESASRTPRKILPQPSRVSKGVTIVLALAVGAVGFLAALQLSPTAPVVRLQSSPTGARLEGDGFVVDDGTKGPQLCLGVILDTYVPRCDGLALIGWDWDQISGEMTTGDAKWGSYHVVGKLQGSEFIVTSAIHSDRTASPNEPSTETPCAEPVGGWLVPDSKRTSRSDATAAVRLADASTGFAGAWTTQVEEQRTVLNLAFTGDLAEHEREARRDWGGPLCVTHQDRTLDELEAIQSQISRNEGADFGLSVLHSEIDVVRNQVLVRAVYADESATARLIETFGEGAVGVSSALTEVTQ